MKIAKYISYFFHPINFSLIGTIIYFLLVPKYIPKTFEYSIIGIIFIGAYILPILLLFILKKFERIDSLINASIEERKLPKLFFILIVFLIGNWLFKFNIIDLLSLFFFGCGIFLSISFSLLELKYKASLHTAGIGGLIGFLFCFSYFYKINTIALFILLFLISGVIASARLKLKAHTFGEITTGFLIGILSQIAVFGFYSISL